ncbi:hypothetical protein QTP88_016653 [Uroleucon formosanum]
MRIKNYNIERGEQVGAQVFTRRPKSYYHYLPIRVHFVTARVKSQLGKLMNS